MYYQKAPAKHFFPFFPKNQETEKEKEMVGEEFAVEMEEELREDLRDDVQEEVEDTDQGPHEDSAPSTEDYSSQSEEHDGIDSSNTVK